MLNMSRMTAVIGLALGLVHAACDKTPSRVPCTAETDTTTCKAGETCLWIHDGAGYFCATACSGGAGCPSGSKCKAGAASGCQTCQNLIDVCE